MILAFFDFETTGKDLLNDRVTQLAVALYDSVDKKMLGCYSNTLYSEEYPPIHPDASKITGMTDERLKRVGELPRESFIILMHYFTKAEKIIGHNIRQFDLPILMEEMKRMLMPIEAFHNVIDTRFDLEIPDHIATRKLAYLAVEHGINAIGAHAAIFDVIMNAELFFKYDVDRTILLSQTPEIWIRAHVKFEGKDDAKDRKFRWDGKNKFWVKQIKENHYESEKENANFTVSKLENYTYPEEK